MSNICINTLSAEGTSKQMDELIRKMQEVFEADDLDIDDNIVAEEKTYASFILSSSWQMPKKELLEVTNSLSDTEGLHIRMVSEEIGEEYYEHSIFKNGKWSFENPPSINEQIHQLTVQGLEQIRQHLTEKGNIVAIDEDNNWSAYYTNGDGYAESAYYSEIELDNGKISVLLSDGIWLYEDDLTTIHVMDILTIIAEGHGTYQQ
ncbi:MAG: hypothetical protein LBI60_04700 [Bacteroidales bacterium]|jgi:hypothetical protein|nr:hypothetical protein [Bacteroidales bacterium]